MKCRILLYAEGNFSYTRALCKKLSQEINSTSNKKYELVATDFGEHNTVEICEQINAEIRDDVKDQFKITVLDKVDATKTDSRIEGKYDLIICNFPTPFNDYRLPLDDLFAQVKASNLLARGGKLQIAYWVTEENGQYEYYYRFAKAQKSNGYFIIERSIFPAEEMHTLGYDHTLYLGAKNQISSFPMVATYQLSDLAKKEMLEPKDYDELSDSEELKNDAMLPRGRNDKTKHRTDHYREKLNFKGKRMLRWDNRLNIFLDNPIKYSLIEISKLIDKGEYRQADVRLTVLIEAANTGKIKAAINAEPGICFNTSPGKELVKKINEHYDKSTIEKPDTENLKNYYNDLWHAKLKVLTGVKIPKLARKYNWN